MEQNAGRKAGGTLRCAAGKVGIGTDSVAREPGWLVDSWLWFATISNQPYYPSLRHHPTTSNSHQNIGVDHEPAGRINQPQQLINHN